MTEHDGHPDVRQPSGSSGASELRREQPAHEGKRLLALEASLFDNDLLLLCYLVQEPAERDAIMVKLMNDAGLAGGRKKARAWFFEKAQAPRRRLAWIRLSAIDGIVRPIAVSLEMP